MFPCLSRLTLFPYTTLFRSLGLFQFLPEKKGVAGDLPAFRFSTWKEGLLAELPAPATAFGLSLGFTVGTDAGLKELAGLKRSEEHTSELQSHSDLVCRLLLE